MLELLRALPVLSGTVAEPGFDTAPNRPEGLFTDWLRSAIAAGEPEPHAMTLSTCGEGGLPDARVLILKNLDDSGWSFASSRLSAKGRQLAARPSAALTFYWKGLGRQVRVRGTVAPASRAASARDFQARGLGARAVALASLESEPLSSPAECQAAVAGAARRLDGDGDLVADHWTLYILAAREVEFWQADAHRQHRRLHYKRASDGWTKSLLWP
jgi:pyridoxamine 5'-phosphate oxidase